MKQRIEYIPIVRTIPENTKDGLYTCTIGYSPQLGFIRVYPMPIQKLKIWGRYSIEVERNKRDSRKESWKLSSYSRHEGFVGFEQDCIYLGDYSRDLIINLAQSMAYPSISKLNDDRKSIGFILSDKVNARWDKNERFINTSQINLFEDVELPGFAKYTKDSRHYESRITFVDGDGTHDYQLNDWQYYEYQRKHGSGSEAFRHVNNKGTMLLFVGNLHHHRSTWMCLKAVKAKEMPSQSILSL